VFPNRIEILSYPGPVPPLGRDNLMSRKVTARRCRNRRIGDFLKELHLAEGRGTGFPKIRRTLEANGSPGPIFETDEERTYFLTTLHIHPESQVSERVDAVEGLSHAEFNKLVSSLSQVCPRSKRSKGGSEAHNTIRIFYF